MTKATEECRLTIEESRAMVERAKREQKVATAAVKAGKERIAEARAFLKTLQKAKLAPHLRSERRRSMRKKLSLGLDPQGLRRS